MKRYSSALATYSYITTTLGILLTSHVQADDLHAGKLKANELLHHELSLAKTLCSSPDTTPIQLEKFERQQDDIIFRGNRVGTKVLFTSSEFSVTLEVIEGRQQRVFVTTATLEGDKTLPSTRIMLDHSCRSQAINRINYKYNTATYIDSFDQALQLLPQKEWLNPPLPTSFGKNDGVKVAVIDSGVNYTLKSIADSLAIDTNGKLIGYDFWDNDNQPYDANPARSEFSVQRHGTRTASILINEAPNIALVPYRYPRPDMTRMRQLIEHAASHAIRIIGMPLGSNRYQDWLTFESVAAEHPQILFIVSAGNNGRDIDSEPVYPAGFEHPNILVVTSANDYVRPADRTNYGKISVDYLLPAENIPATDYSGETALVSGSSYAVSRIAALAARILSKNTNITTEHLKAAIASYSIKAKTGAHVSTGYIGDPLADTVSLSVESLDISNPTYQAQENILAVNFVRLDKRWTRKRMEAALETLNALYRQCGISVSIKQALHVDGAGHTENLTPGNALTLHRKLSSVITFGTPTIYFANDTNMQVKFDAEAFGMANTTTRPWMQNTVWISENSKDSNNALAHELFHVITNSGHHSDLAGNLMLSTTEPNNTRLSTEQCQSARENASAQKLFE